MLLPYSPPPQFDWVYFFLQTFITALVAFFILGLIQGITAKLKRRDGKQSTQPSAVDLSAVDIGVITLLLLLFAGLGAQGQTEKAGEATLNSYSDELLSTYGVTLEPQALKSLDLLSGAIPSASKGSFFTPHPVEVAYRVGDEPRSTKLIAVYRGDQVELLEATTTGELLPFDGVQE